MTIDRIEDGMERSTSMEGNTMRGAMGTGATALEQVPFHSGVIEAQSTGDGGWAVSLRRCCETLNVDYSAQLKRLKGQPWATVAVIATVGADGKTRDMAMLDRRTFTMWLATIDTSRVKNPDAKTLIATYQCEAADALDQYFHQGATPTLAELAEIQLGFNLDEGIPMTVATSDDLNDGMEGER